MPIFTKKHVESLKMKLINSSRFNCKTRFLLWLMETLFLSKRRLYEHMQRRGVVVVLWSANSEEEFDQIYSVYGRSIDGVMTDRPKALTEYIRKKIEN